MSTRKLPAAAPAMPAAPWLALAEVGRQQVALATDTSVAVMHGMQETARFWQEMAVAGFALQARLLASLGLPDPEAMLASANVLE